MSHLCEAGIVTENEQKIIESVDEKCIQHPKYWMSLVWAGAIVTRAKKEGRIKDDFAFRTIIKEINKFRSGCGGLLDYDWISIPLVYTQVGCDWWRAGHVMTILTPDWSTPGRDPRCVHLLRVLADGQTVPGHQQGVRGSRGGSLRSHLHLPAVLLLHGLAQGRRGSDKSLRRG